MQRGYKRVGQVDYRPRDDGYTEVYDNRITFLATIGSITIKPSPNYEEAGG